MFVLKENIGTYECIYIYRNNNFLQNLVLLNTWCSHFPNNLSRITLTTIYSFSISLTLYLSGINVIIQQKLKSMDTLHWLELIEIIILYHSSNFNQWNCIILIYIQHSQAAFSYPATFWHELPLVTGLH